MHCVLFIYLLALFNYHGYHMQLSVVKSVVSLQRFSLRHLLMIRRSVSSIFSGGRGKWRALEGSDIRRAYSYSSAEAV